MGTNEKKRRRLLRQALALCFVLAVIYVAFSRYRTWTLRDEFISASFINSAGKSSADFTLAIAATPGTREKGLMYRKEMDKRSGMLFVYPLESVHQFWMKNTYIPLDMIFIDKDGVVVGVVENVPVLNEQRRGVDKPAKYVVELNAGQAREWGISAGAKIKINRALAEIAAR